MKLIYAIVHDEDSIKVVGALNEKDFRVTKLNSSGGFLRAGNTTLMLVVSEAQVEDALEIIKTCSRSRKSSINVSVIPGPVSGAFVPYPVEVNVGGATVFIVNVEYFEQM